MLNERNHVKPDRAPTPNYEALYSAHGKRYVEYATDEKELYNLRTDPYELANGYDPDAPPSELVSRLHALEGCRAGTEITCQAAEDGR